MNESNESVRPQQTGGVARKLLMVGLPLLVLGAGILVAMALVKSSPHAAKQPPPRTARLVETRAITFGPQPTVVQAHGTVQPSREVVIYPRVSGEVIEISPALIPGGRLSEGDMLVKIDPADFILAVRQRETDLVRAKASLTQEMGQQAVAQREFDLLGEDIPEASRDLVLRQPQLEQAKAAVAAAEAALDLANLNLERTTVKAPFNGTVRVRNVNAGTQVNTVTPLLTFTGSDEYWIELTVPVDQLRWIQVPVTDGEHGSKVRMKSESSRNGHSLREGEVLRLLPDLEPNGRLARLLVRVSDPLALIPANAGKAPLILGDYVSAEIEGVGIANATALERGLFHDGDLVWVMNGEMKLEIRPVTVAFRGPEKLVVTGGVKEGDLVITTDLPAAVEGMALRGAGDRPPGGPDNGLAAREGGGKGGNKE